LTKSEFICDFLALAGSVFYALASSLVIKGDMVAICSFHRNKGDGDFTEREKDILNSLLPHMANALRNLNYMHVMEPNKQMSEFGFLSMGDDGYPFYMNERTERLMKGIVLASSLTPILVLTQPFLRVDQVHTKVG
jgi:hypothetical protein